MAVPLVPVASAHAIRSGVPITGISDFVNARVLGAGAETETVPAGYQFVVVSPTADIYFRRGATASVPVADVTDGTASTLQKGGAVRVFAVAAGNTISVIAPSGTAIVTFEYFGQ